LSSEWIPQSLTSLLQLPSPEMASVGSSHCDHSSHPISDQNPFIPYTPETLYEDFARGSSGYLMSVTPPPTPTTTPNSGLALGEVDTARDKYSASLDVSDYEPGEIWAHLCGNELTIEGEHHAKSGKRSIQRFDDFQRMCFDFCSRPNGSPQSNRLQSRSFVRKFSLPGDANLDSISSSLSHGRMTIEIPKKSNDPTQSSDIPMIANETPHCTYPFS
ncbi:hypothetical protein PENTCL1PPCAC_16062, partial [Pristionchus entomophagus]